MTDIEVRMDDLEKRVLALEERTRRFLWPQAASADREEALVAQYGEYVNKSTAAKILCVTRATVYAMLADGRLQGACEGKRVSTRSIARFICSDKRKENDTHADEDS